jgi:hypothetical protein
MDSTNKSLLTMAVISLLVSAGGTFILIDKIQLVAITGRSPTPVTQGNASFNLQGQAVVNVSQPTINWGNVAVSQGNDSCEINSENGASYRCSTCSGTPCTVANSGFTFHNIGSVNLNVSVAAGKSAADFIGGTLAGGPQYLWKARNKTAVTGWVENIISTYSATSLSATSAYFNMSATNTTSTEEAYLDLNITIPRDAAKGAKTDTLTFTAVETTP